MIFHLRALPISDLPPMIASPPPLQSLSCSHVWTMLVHFCVVLYGT